MRRTALGAAPVGRQPAPVYNGSRTPRKYFAPYGSHSTCTVEISQNCSSAQIRREHEGEDGAERDARKKTAPHPRAPVSAKEAERTLMQLTQVAGKRPLSPTPDAGESPPLPKRNAGNDARSARQLHRQLVMKMSGKSGSDRAAAGRAARRYHRSHPVM